MSQIDFHMSNGRDITGIILAGGKSSRMGTDKGVVELNGSCMISHVINSLKQVTDKIIIVANNDNYARFGFPVYSDLIKDCGPMGGIVTGLHYSETESNLVLSCDIPFVDSDLLRRLTTHFSEADVLAAKTENGTEPLCARYNKSCESFLRNCLELKIFSLRKALAQMNCEYINAESAALKNINTPQELNNCKSTAV